MRRPMQMSESADVMNMYGLCKALHCLPEAGGLNDQDSLLVHFFMIIEAAEAERAIAERGRGQG